MLINLSNHPVENWTEKQIEAAKKLYGSVRDLPFPQINPFADENDVLKKAEIYIDEILAIFENSNDETNAVHVMGELTFTYAVVKNLSARKIKCIASTTERNVSELNGNKIVKFGFVRFREYK